jgi:hypothetical protein
VEETLGLDSWYAHWSVGDFNPVRLGESEPDWCKSGGGECGEEGSAVHYRSIALFN